MSTTITLPDFYDLEIVTSEKMQALVDALNSKFAAGTGSEDIMWPLTAGGDIDMGVGSAGHSILNGKKIFEVVNAASYTTFQDAIDAAGSGGSVFIPPGTTIEASGVTIDNNNITIFGAGPSSVLELTSGASSGSLLRTTSTSTRTSGVRILDITLSGNSGTGTGQNGLQLDYVDDVIIERVVFDDFSGQCISVRNNGSAGQYSKSISVEKCIFLDGDSQHIWANDVALIDIRKCIFQSCTNMAIYMYPDTSSSYMNDINVCNCLFTGGDSTCVYIAGHATASDTAARITVCDNNCVGITGSADVLQIGVTDHVLRDITVSGNKVRVIASTANVLEVYATSGHVVDNIFINSAAIGINLAAAVDIMIANNCCTEGTGYGIDASEATDCVIHGNDLRGNTAGALKIDGSSGCEYYDNIGVEANRPPSNGWYYAHPVDAASATVVTGGTITFLPGMLREGTNIKVRAYCTDGGTAGESVIRVNWDGTTFMDGTIQCTTGLSAEAEGGLVTADIMVTGATTLQGTMSVIQCDDSEVNSLEVSNLGGQNFVTSTHTLTISASTPANMEADVLNYYVTLDQFEIVV